jgi:hypothetical protein
MRAFYPVFQHTNTLTCLCLHVVLHIVLFGAHAAKCHVQLAEGAALHSTLQLRLVDEVMATVPVMRAGGGGGGGGQMQGGRQQGQQQQRDQEQQHHMNTGRASACVFESFSTGHSIV